MPHTDYVRCPTSGDFTGCGSIFRTDPDWEGFHDCIECGLWFKPEHVRPGNGSPHRSTDYYLNPAPSREQRWIIVYAYIAAVWLEGRCTMADACDLASERDRSLGGPGCHRMADDIVSRIY